MKTCVSIQGRKEIRDKLEKKGNYSLTFLLPPLFLSTVKYYRSFLTLVCPLYTYSMTITHILVMLTGKVILIMFNVKGKRHKTYDWTSLNLLIFNDGKPFIIFRLVYFTTALGPGWILLLLRHHPCFPESLYSKYIPPKMSWTEYIDDEKSPLAPSIILSIFSSTSL